MGKYNATFKYKLNEDLSQGADGFWDSNDNINWAHGGYCYVEKHIPAKELKGIDGTLFLYSYEIFLPKEFKIKLTIGSQILLRINRNEEPISITGIDDTGKKHIVLWG